MKTKLHVLLFAFFSHFDFEKTLRNFEKKKRNFMKNKFKKSAIVFYTSVTTE